MKFRFSSQALEEFKKATQFYEERQIGLGDRFVASVEAAISSVVSSPQMYPIFEEPDIRRKLVRVFPYAILYSDEGTCVRIVAVMHTHQAPDYWKSRLE